jgi:hypothetical protein
MTTTEPMLFAGSCYYLLASRGGYRFAHEQKACFSSTESKEQ